MKKRSKALGLWTALALVVGNMVGAGAYLVPASLGAFGSIGLVGWVLTSLGAIFLALVLSLIHISEPTRLDLASRMPSSA